ncbi:coiled-coil domain-containing protein 97 isoform X2 [Lepidochelys kempii]|uniref:coiled-coil domain-containing protein 97 isoform X2 n=1 Tax=Lepidochelys kempii TaxID=8472 RepID=UPI003C6FB5D5
MEAESEARARPTPPGSTGAWKSREQQEPEAAPSPLLAESPAPGDRPPNTSGVTEPPQGTSRCGEGMLERPAPQHQAPNTNVVTDLPQRMSQWGEGLLERPALGDRPPKSNGVTEPPRQTWHWGEEMLERPAPGDRPPKSNGVTESPRQTWHWGEEMLERPAPGDRPPKSNGVTESPRQTWHWGEEMLESPAPQDQPPKNTGVTTPPRHPSPSGEVMLVTPALGDHSPDSSRLGEQLQGPSQQRGGMLEPTPAVGLAHQEPGAQEPAGPPEAGERALLAMLTAVASSPLPVRSQQKDEPDLTAEEKLAILRALYRDKPVVFLERFRRALRVEHLGCFAHLAARYEVRFYCDEVRRAARGKAGHTRVRNKRYAALQQLIKGGEYFSDEQMRAREPLLYEQYIGQYLSDEELLALGSQALAGPCSLSGVLLDSYQEQVLQLRLHIQQEQEDACMEEEEEDDEGEDSSSASDAWVPDTEEKAFLREEFTSRMHQRFLDGKDGDFDYRLGHPASLWASLAPRSWLSWAAQSQERHRGAAGLGKGLPRLCPAPSRGQRNRWISGLSSGPPDPRGREASQWRGEAQGWEPLASRRCTGKQPLRGTAPLVELARRVGRGDAVTIKALQ